MGKTIKINGVEVYEHYVEKYNFYCSLFDKDKIVYQLDEYDNICGFNKSDTFRKYYDHILILTDNVYTTEGYEDGQEQMMDTNKTVYPVGRRYEMTTAYYNTESDWIFKLPYTELHKLIGTELDVKFKVQSKKYILESIQVKYDTGYNTTKRKSEPVLKLNSFCLVSPNIIDDYKKELKLIEDLVEFRKELDSFFTKYFKDSKTIIQPYFTPV